jgi:hypothetical protein
MVVRELHESLGTNGRNDIFSLYGLIDCISPHDNPDIRTIIDRNCYGLFGISCFDLTSREFIVEYLITMLDLDELSWSVVLNAFDFWISV